MMPKPSRRKPPASAVTVLERWIRFVEAAADAPSIVDSGGEASNVLVCVSCTNQLDSRVIARAYKDTQDRAKAFNMMIHEQKRTLREKQEDEVEVAPRTVFRKSAYWRRPLGDGFKGSSSSSSSSSSKKDKNQKKKTVKSDCEKDVLSNLDNMVKNRQITADEIERELELIRDLETDVSRLNDDLRSILSVSETAVRERNTLLEGRNQLCLLFNVVDEGDLTPTMRHRTEATPPLGMNDRLGNQSPMISINGLRLAFCPSAQDNLNWAEINAAWGCCAAALGCYRRLFGLADAIDIFVDMNGEEEEQADGSSDGLEKKRNGKGSGGDSAPVRSLSRYRVTIQALRRRALLLVRPSPSSDLSNNNSNKGTSPDIVMQPVGSASSSSSATTYSSGPTNDVPDYSLAAVGSTEQHPPPRRLRAGSTSDSRPLALNLAGNDDCLPHRPRLSPAALISSANASPSSSLFSASASTLSRTAAATYATSKAGTAASTGTTSIVAAVSGQRSAEVGYARAVLVFAACVASTFDEAFRSRSHGDASPTSSSSSSSSASSSASTSDTAEAMLLELRQRKRWKEVGHTCSVHVQAMERARQGLLSAGGGKGTGQGGAPGPLLLPPIDAAGLTTDISVALSALVGQGRASPDMT